MIVVLLLSVFFTLTYVVVMVHLAKAITRWMVR